MFYKQLCPKCSQIPKFPSSQVPKFESLLSSFLFGGKSERVKLEELFNKPAKGGLGLLDFKKKADSLLIKQLARMLLKDKDGA